VGVAVAEGPIFPGGFHQIDDDVLRADAWGSREEFDDAFVEGAFLLGLAAEAQRDLDEDHFVGTVDVEVVGVVDQAFSGMFGDYLEAVGCGAAIASTMAWWTASAMARR
jgi:hypothetical protein